MRPAVTYPPDGPLQVLAGPGSGERDTSSLLLFKCAHFLGSLGKTKVLTCRVAYLVHHHHLQPDEIVAVCSYHCQCMFGYTEIFDVLSGDFHQ